ncbi:cobW-domain-containing protein [Ramicandelaber brevisporus]|nr:cobW-domain-containing protein [Ramicandelaber brevisporus]
MTPTATTATTTTTTTTSTKSGELRELPTSSTPITVFTGFLGAGKTTLIIKILQSLPVEHKTVILKNEFGSSDVDAALVREPQFKITEMINGCLCCVLVGQLKNALLDIKEQFNPDRIIVETSGSAFPAPIAWQIRQMDQSQLHLDAILTVVDCANFRGYEDTSYTAKLQAQYTDLILLNKVELVNERELDDVIEHINELNEDTPRIMCRKDEPIDIDLLFDLNSKLADDLSHQHGHDADKCGGGVACEMHDHHDREIDVVGFTRKCNSTLDEAEKENAIDLDKLTLYLDALPKDSVYRVKGFVRLPDVSVTTSLNSTELAVKSPHNLYILNWAFGRYAFTPVESAETAAKYEGIAAAFTVMGIDLALMMSRLQTGLQMTDDKLVQISSHFRSN